MYDILALALSHTGTIATSIISATGAVIVNKTWFSKKEKKIENREDFKAITDTLFTELASLREDVDKYKEEAIACESKYNDLQDRFIEFKSKYSEIELRYQIQVNLNRKLSEEIRTIEAKFQAHLDKTANEQRNIITNSEDTSERK